MVIRVAWSQGDIEQFSMLIDHQMQLKPIEPIYRGFAWCCQISKHAVTSNATIVTNLEASGIDETDSRAITQAVLGVNAHTVAAHRPSIPQSDCS